MMKVQSSTAGRAEVLCECGKPQVEIPTELVMGSGVVEELPEVLKRLDPTGASEIVVLFDPVTHSLFGETVLQPLREAGLTAKTLVLGEEGHPFEPDEEAVKAVRKAVGAARLSSDALLVGVGSGAINDLGKHISAQEGVKYVCVATAPSMDGFAAPISAIVVNKVKTTVESRCPDAVVADLEILRGAPPAMISAGFGDALGKLTSLADWKLAHVLFDEHWCRVTADEVGRIARRVWQSAESVAARSTEGVRDLMEALFLAGTSVVHVGRSRPTSGGEHLFSHFVEMWHLNRGLRPPAHGHVVGVGTLLVSRIAEALKGLDRVPGAVSPGKLSPKDVLEALRIDEVPGNFGMGKFDEAQAAQRLERIRARWDQVLEVLDAIPSSKEIEEALRTVGCPTRLSELGLDRETGRFAIESCRYVRERYTLIDLAADVGVFPAMVDELVEAYG